MPTPTIIKSCDKCAKVNVCGIFRAIAPLMKNFEPNLPFKPEALATICADFLSAEAVKLLLDQEDQKPGPFQPTEL